MKFLNLVRKFQTIYITHYIKSTFKWAFCILKIMQKININYLVGKSKTSKRILDVFIEGSSPTRKQIQTLYCAWSKTEVRKKQKNGYKSKRQTKLKRANRLYNKFIKLGYWKERE